MVQQKCVNLHRSIQNSPSLGFFTVAQTYSKFQGTEHSFTDLQKLCTDLSALSVGCSSFSTI
jgi:hypothetical protein